jgi:hypothetical protein
MAVESATVPVHSLLVDVKEAALLGPLLVDAKQASKMLSISPRHVAGMHSSGRLGPLPIALGRRRLWRVAELVAWVLAGCPRREIWIRLQGENNKVCAGKPKNDTA